MDWQKILSSDKINHDLKVMAAEVYSQLADAGLIDLMGANKVLIRTPVAIPESVGAWMPMLYQFDSEDEAKDFHKRMKDASNNHKWDLLEEVKDKKVV